VLILPLHRAPTRANFPWVTLGLILANLFVFAFLQSGDGRVQERALDYYMEQDLANWEFPAYRDWLDQRAGADQRRVMFARFADAGDAGIAVQLLQSDADFLVDLRTDKVIAPSAVGHAQWRERRDEFDRLWNAGFTERWMLHFSEVDPQRIFGAMFLHGGIGHLLGNMLFLALLGLLVEGALGHGLFLVVYLVGGFGSALLSLAWRWGETGSALGASGAIAALMGAYCVLWGRRKVRFFWWFLVAFDYVKAPALVLLPFWLGWELLNLLWNKGAHVGFDAHAGGIVTGALLALGVRALGWERRDFLDEDEIADAAADDRAGLVKAQEHLGRLEVSAARALLEPIVARTPEDFDVLAALYRCARYEPRTPRLDEAARAVLTHPTRINAEIREQKAIFDDYAKAGGNRVLLTPTQLISLVTRWPMIGAGADAVTALMQLIDRAPATPHLDLATLRLAHDLRARGDAPHAKRLLERIIAAWPSSGEATKARVLLADGP
jgi:membrane associated rhomboid family serine protease